MYAMMINQNVAINNITDQVGPVTPCSLCSHGCLGDKCTCPSGYMLAADDRTCIGEFDETRN